MSVLYWLHAGGEGLIEGWCLGSASELRSHGRVRDTSHQCHQKHSRCVGLGELAGKVPGATEIKPADGGSRTTYHGSAAHRRISLVEAGRVLWGTLGAHSYRRIMLIIIQLIVLGAGACFGAVMIIVRHRKRLNQ